MEKELIKKNGEDGIEREKELIKKVLLAKIHGDYSHDLYVEQLKQEVDKTNEYVRGYLDYIDLKPDEISTGFESVVSESVKYRDMIALKNKIDSGEGNISDDIIYRTNNVNFTFHYNQTKELLKMMQWYFDNNYDITSSKEKLVDAVLESEVRMLPLRNELTDRELNLNIPEEDLKFPNFHALLVSFMKMLLVHHFTKGTLAMAFDTFKNNKAEDSISGNMLYLLFDTAAVLKLAKEYGISKEELGLVDIIKDAKKPFVEMGDRGNFSDILDKLDYLVEDVDSFLDSYSKEREK